MEDRQIIDLYWARSEAAIEETAARYGRRCADIAYRILKNREDAEECVNDVYRKAWEAIPPARPESLGGFLAKLTRNHALNRWQEHRAAKRGGGETALALEELAECISGPESTDGHLEEELLRQALDRFLAELEAPARRMFLQRYWYLCSVKEIARENGAGESRVKMTLLRTREKLKRFLEEEGIQ